MNKVQDYPVFTEIVEHVVGSGNAAGDASNIGSVLYTRGMYAAMLAAEAIEKAQEIHGTSEITAEMMRDGMEALEVTEATMEAWGAPGIGPVFSVSCEDHGGSGMGLVQQRNAEADGWEPLTDYIAPDEEVLQPLIEEDSMAYAAENDIELRCQ